MPEPGPSHNPDVFHEPHLRPLGSHPVCARCGYDLSGLPAGRCPECGAKPFEPSPDEAERVDQSVWDEPGLSRPLAGDPGEDQLTFAAWFRRKRGQTTALRSWMTVLGVALAAGPWAVLGTFWGGGQSVVSVLALTLLGPMVEEVMKISAATYVVERRPYLFRSRAQVLACGLAAGFAFAAIENVLYLAVYVAEPSPAPAAWRWTVCVALHMACTTITSLGLARIWRQVETTGRRPDLAVGFPHLVTAIVVHGSYNGLALLTSFAPADF